MSDVGSTTPAQLAVAGAFRKVQTDEAVIAADVGDGLSTRERDVLRLLGEGCTNKEMAQRLGVAPETIKSHIKHIFRKLAVERRAHAVSRGHDLGLIGREPQPALSDA